MTLKALHQVKLVTMGKLVLLPITYMLLATLPVLQAFVMGLLTLTVFLDVQKNHGIVATLFKPDRELVR